MSSQSALMSSRPPPFSAFIGPAFVIICFAFMLYGAFCAQVCYYWTNYNDNGKIQSLVILVTVLETAHTGLCLQFFYEYLINAWGDPVAAGKVVPTIAATIYLVLAISSLVQGWYIYRIWQLRKQIIPVAFMVCIFLAHIGLSFRATAYTTTYDTWVEVYNDGHFVTEVNWTFGLNIALDTSITSVLLYYLWRDRTQAIKRSTKKMVKGLINLAFSTGVLTVLTSCGFFIALNVDKHTLTFGAMIELIAKLYANSMLAMLNARQSVIQAATADTKFGLELSNLRSHITPSSGHGGMPQIHVRPESSARISSPGDASWANKRIESEENMHYTVFEERHESKVSAI